jgi:hypothetical protein
MTVRTAEIGIEISPTGIVGVMIAIVTTAVFVTIATVIEATEGEEMSQAARSGTEEEGATEDHRIGDQQTGRDTMAGARPTKTAGLRRNRRRSSRSIVAVLSSRNRWRGMSVSC